MEKLIDKKAQALAALNTLDLAINKFAALDPSDYYYQEIRDSVIKRFEYSIDTFWKYLKIYLELKHALVPPSSPKGVFKMALDAQVITIDDEAELRLLIENRNLTSHAYNAYLADEIGKIIPEHYMILHKIMSNITI